MITEELLINVNPQETRVALLENGVIQELFIERTRARGLVGNIYKGKVCRVLPGMQAAFVEIGLERAAFLHASDVIQALTETNNPNKKPATISELLYESQQIVVQVIKDPLGTKGARLTTQLSIPSRYLVCMPQVNHIGVSQKIESEAERNRLKQLLTQLAGDPLTEGYIVRTAAEGVSEAALQFDLRYLQQTWQTIKVNAGQVKTNGLIYEDLPLALRALRDLAVSHLEKIRIDSRENYQRIKAFAQAFIPELANYIEHYTSERPIFDLYCVEDEVQKALQREVKLKSGGHLVIDQTEAMTTIDVNTGAFVGSRNLEETIFKTNLEAAQAIARQLRLRNLGGIIIIDFIDMLEQEHKRQVLRMLEKCLENDHSRCQISEVSSLGLVQMTRKRTRESIQRVLCEPCPTCQGKGFLKTAETICYEIFREILRTTHQFEVQKFLILASQPVVDLLLDEESTSLAELEAFIHKPIQFQVETSYSQEHYDVVLM